MAKITVPHALLDASAEIRNDASLALAKGATCKSLGNSALYTVDNNKLELEKAKQLVSAGCPVTDYPLFIEVYDKEDLVPEGVPGFEYREPEGEDMIRHTWSTWLSPNHRFLERDGRLFAGSNGHSGTDLPLDDLQPVFDSLIHPKDLPAPPDPVE